MMKPILFNTEMVQAIQDGRKTATRRVIRWDRNDVIKVASARGKVFGYIPEDKPIPELLLTWYIISVLPRPFKVGDVLWIRETWDFLPCITCMERDCTLKPAVYEDAEAITEGCWLYRADGDNLVGWGGHKWRPSIHMPKQAARIFLRVTEVFLERLQKIDEAGAIAEGLYAGWRQTESSTPARTARQAFMWIWQWITRKGPVEQSWAADPWVWVIRFERIEKPAGWPEA